MFSLLKDVQEYSSNMQQLFNREFTLNFYFVILALIGCQLADFTSAHEYLHEKPSFLQPCQLYDPNHGQCLANAFENLFTNWHDGVPGLKGLSPIDPFKVKRVRFRQRTEGLADIKVELKNVEARGMGETRVLRATVNPRDYTIEFKLFTPVIDIDSDYKANGRILLLNVDGDGNVTSTIDNLEYRIIAKTNLRRVGGVHFFEIVSLMPKIDNVGNFKIHLTNLIGGNVELENRAQTLINNNWREIFQVMSPALSQTISAVIFDRFKRVLLYVPADYFLDDLP